MRPCPAIVQKGQAHLTKRVAGKRLFWAKTKVCANKLVPIPVAFYVAYWRTSISLFGGIDFCKNVDGAAR
jgi:hypothetical protein